MEKVFVLAMLVFLVAVVVTMLFKSKYASKSATTDVPVRDETNTLFGKFEFSSIPLHEMNRIDFDITHPLHDSNKDD